MSKRAQATCDHWVGVISGEFDYDDPIMITIKDLEPWLIIPYKFNYCPRCGERILWPDEKE